MAASQRLTQAICVALVLVCFQCSFTTGCGSVSPNSGWVRASNHTDEVGSKYCLLISSTSPFVFEFTEFESKHFSYWLVIFTGPTEESLVLIQDSKIPTSPVISTTGQNLIMLTSSSSDFYPEFNASAEPHKCQYELTPETGSFSSPNHPYNYPPQADCSWLINAKQPIILSFTENTLDKCCDILTIYDGPIKSASVLASSKDILPTTLISTTNQMLITFTSSSYEQCCAIPISRFTATYTTSEYQHYLSSETGEISSQNYPDVTRWLINAKDTLTLSFPLLQMRSNDSLTIYDGPTESSRLLVKISSNETTPPLILTSTGQALIIFTSEGLKPLSEFNVVYSSTRKCEYVLSSDSGWFTSPNHPYNYPLNTNCSWLINATHPIKLSFAKFYLSGYSDTIMVYDGPTDSFPVLSAFSSLLAPSLIVSTTNEVLVTFTSYSFGTPNIGFNATYELSGCQYISSPDSGWIASSNRQLSLPGNSNKCWFISAAQPISLSFTHLHLEENEDWLKVYDGPTSGIGVELLKTSSNIPPPSAIASLNEMLIIFTSKSSSSFSGFNATYQPYSCQHVLSSESGWFASPNFPNNYPGNSNCSWLINATQPITLSFTRIQIQYYVDQLMFYDGPTTSSPVLFYPSRTDSDAMVMSTGNQIFVTLNSVRGSSYPGFNITYQPNKCQYITSTDSGWFTSPNHPLNYPDNCNTCWLISSEQSIKLSFTHFHLEEHKDWLQVYDGWSNSAELMNVSSLNTSTPIIRRTRKLLVIFTSDSSVSFSGFNATYETYSFADYAYEE